MNNNKETTLYDMQKQINYKQILHCVTYKNILLKKYIKDMTVNTSATFLLKMITFRKLCWKKKANISYLHPQHNAGQYPYLALVLTVLCYYISWSFKTMFKVYAPFWKHISKSKASAVDCRYLRDQIFVETFYLWDMGYAIINSFTCPAALRWSLSYH